MSSNVKDMVRKEVAKSRQNTDTCRLRKQKTSPLEDCYKLNSIRIRRFLFAWQFHTTCTSDSGIPGIEESDLRKTC
jgi:hypothetical protein